MDFEDLNNSVLDWEVCSILVPQYYGIDQANQAVLQLGKKINKVSLVGYYYFYPQFRCNTRCLQKVKLINDIKLLLVKRLYS
jgi:hypothetical protein